MQEISLSSRWPLPLCIFVAAVPLHAELRGLRVMSQVAAPLRVTSQPEKVQAPALPRKGPLLRLDRLCPFA